MLRRVEGYPVPVSKLRDGTGVCSSSWHPHKPFAHPHKRISPMPKLCRIFKTRTKLFLNAAALLAAVPICFGLLSTTPTHAQSQSQTTSAGAAQKYEYEIVS